MCSNFHKAAWAIPHHRRWVKPTGKPEENTGSYLVTYLNEFYNLVNHNPYTMLTTGLRIKKLRELRDFSQVYMAKKLGISQEQYSYLETKQKSITDEQLKSIATLLAVKEDYLKTFDPESIIKNNGTGQAQEYLSIQNLIIESHENERKLFVELITRLKEELAELKQKLDESKLKIIGH